VPWYSSAIHCTVWFGFVHGRKCYFIDPHSQDNFFKRGSYYGYSYEYVRMAFFTKAALEFMLKTNKRPDVIHTHDWQTALAPVLLYEIYRSHGMENQRTCHTIHNFKHQGIAGENILWATGLGRPDYYYAQDHMDDNFNSSAINFTKGAIVYSNFYQHRISASCMGGPPHGPGYGIGHILHVHQGKFGGVLNGLDYEMWNPETDPHMASHYTVESLDKNYDNKKRLRERVR